MLTTIEYETWAPIVSDIAWREADRTPSVEPDDVEQEVWVRILSRLGHLRGKATGIIEAFALREARTYCAEQRYAYTFHSGQYCYTPAEVRALFQEAFFQPECWETVPEKEDYRLEVTGKQLIVSLWDLRNSFEALKASDQEIIRKRYTADETIELSGSEKTRLSRAVDKVTKTLNQKMISANQSNTHEGPGARRVLTNTHAAHLTEF